LCTQFLEIFRRAIWNLLRVEWENLKQLNLHSTPLQQHHSDYEEEMATFKVPMSRKIHNDEEKPFLSVTVPSVKNVKKRMITDDDMTAAAVNIKSK
jgi:hypothetical protein